MTPGRGPRALNLRGWRRYVAARPNDSGVQGARGGTTKANSGGHGHRNFGL